MLRRAFLSAFLGSLTFATPAAAQDANSATLTLTATLGPSGPQLGGGLKWRIFNARAEADGSHALIVDTALPQPLATLPPGDYVVHAAFGLASAMTSVSLSPGEARRETVVIAAGALRISATRDGKPLDPSDVQLSIYVPERNNAQAKLVYAKAKLGEVIGVPEGPYHVVSTFIDSVGVGALGGAKAAGGVAAPSPSNSSASADVRVAAGKIVDVTLKHRFAIVTIKLVKTPGGEALANTVFSVLSPGGDVVRELIGSFPSLVLSEGDYVVIARHDAKTYQSTFPVKSGLDRDVEIIAKDNVDQGQ